MKALWLLVGFVVALAGCGDETRRLVSIEVSLGNGALDAPGETQAMAIGTYSNGVEEDITTDVTWSSTNTSIGDVDIFGAVFALSPGQTKIRATLDDVYGEATFTVLEPQLQSITIGAPTQLVPNGLFLQLGATGHYNNGTTRVITGAVAWTTDSTTIATIDATGKLASHSVGGTFVRARQGSVTAMLAVSVTPALLVSLAISPNPVPELPKGLTVELHAIGTFTDGTENDVTDMVVWTAQTEAIATVSSTGLVTAVATSGATNVHATFNASHGTFTDTVTVMAAAPVIVRVEIDPDSLTLPLGRDYPLACTSMYSDATEIEITDLATWDSANDAVVTVDDEGLVVANNTTTGTTQVSCDYLTFSDEIDVTANAAVLDHIEVSPVDPNVLIRGTDVQFSAERVLSNGQRAPAIACTWDDAGVATISATGILEADSVVAGPGMVNWTCDGMSGNSAYTAFAATSLQLVIEDTFGSTPPVGATLDHRAMALTSGPAFDVTSLALFESLTAALQLSATPGEFTAVSAGPGTVRATFDGRVATRSVTVQ